MNKKRLFFAILLLLNVLIVICFERFKIMSYIITFVLICLVEVNMIIILFPSFIPSNFIKNIIQRRKFKHIESGVKIGKDFRCTAPDRTYIGKNSTLGKQVDFFLFDNGKSEIHIGKNVIIGDYNRFACKDNIIIEDDALFAAYVHITDHSHQFKDITRPIRDQGIFGKGPVIIKKGAWLGYRAEILSGVTIGKNSVVAAGAVVTKSVPNYCLVAGCPAKIIKYYDQESGEWVNAGK